MDKGEALMLHTCSSSPLVCSLLKVDSDLELHQVVLLSLGQPQVLIPLEVSDWFVTKVLHRTAWVGVVYQLRWAHSTTAWLTVETLP